MDLEQLRSAAARSGQMVCATTKPGGKPVYFLVPVGASDDDIDAKAFEKRHGRPMLEGERILRRLARERAAR
jgi:hypothetical protein